MTTENMTVSVPCDRGYFFTRGRKVRIEVNLTDEFPSPAIGDIFLLVLTRNVKHSLMLKSFRPLRSGIFFY